MSRFNSAAYDKLFPRSVETGPAPETVVPSFTPTTKKLEGTDPDVSDPEPEQDMLKDEEGSAVIIQDDPDPIITEPDAADPETGGD